MNLYHIITISIAMMLILLTFTPVTNAASEEEEESTSVEPQQTDLTTPGPAPIRPGPFRPGPFRPPFTPFPFFRPLPSPGRPFRPFPFPILPPLNFSGNPFTSNSVAFDETFNAQLQGGDLKEPLILEPRSASL